MKPRPTYLLPPIGEEDAELTCCIIYLPNHEDYRRALMGSLYYLETWVAWERDSLNRGTVAAQLWKEANEKTMECFEMGCFDDLLQAIENLSTNIILNCLCEYIDIDPPSPPIPDPDWGTGDVPTTWGDEDTTGQTWDEYQAIVCGAADAYVDYLKSKNSELMNYLNLGILALGIVSALIALISGFGIAVIISLGTAAAIFQQLIASPGASVFADVNDQLEAAREDIRQAIACHGNLAAVIEGALDSDSWTLFYQWINWEAVTAVIRSGEWSGETLPTPTPIENCCDDELIEGATGLKITVTACTVGFQDSRLFAEAAAVGGVGVWTSQTEMFRGTNAVPRTAARGSAGVLDCGAYNVETGGFNTPLEYDNPYFTLNFANLAGSERTQGITVTCDLASDHDGSTCIPVTSINVIDAPADVVVAGNTITWNHVAQASNTHRRITFSVNRSSA